MQYETLIEEVWSDDSEDERTQDRRMQPANRSRSSGNTALVDRMAATDAMPNTVNVRDSRHVRFGPTIISVTHNESTETVKARFLCLDLETVKQAKRLRCSLAVCACWSTLVSVALTLYVYLLVVSHKTRIDIGLGIYLKKVWTGATVTEKISVFAVPIVLAFCVSIIVYYELKIARLEDDKEYLDKVHSWYVERDEWMAKKIRNNSTSYEPLRLVVVHNSVTHECHTFLECATAMKELQGTFLTEYQMDTPYNFFIGNDGRVYEGRGWGVQGAHCYRFNTCALVIGFFGDYRKPDDGGFSRVTDTQLNNTLKLLDWGIRAGHIHKEYVVAGMKDLVTSESPGYYLYKAIQKWDHYDGDRYKEKTCDQIYFLKSNDELDKAPHEWRINRTMWEAKPFAVTNRTAKYEPLRLVIMQDTISRECHSYVICKIQLQNMQTWCGLSEQDIPYNFIVANDGRVYEARGWGVDGDRRGLYNDCSVSIAFVGDYSEDSNYNSKATPTMLNRTQMILEEGVRLGHLHRDYVIVGAKDMLDSNSPGDNLYGVIQTMSRYDHGLRYNGKMCDEIAAS